MKEQSFQKFVWFLVYVLGNFAWSLCPWNVCNILQQLTAPEASNFILKLNVK